MLHALCHALFEHLSGGVTAHSRTEAQMQLLDSLAPEQQSQPLMDPAVKSSHLKNTFDACTCHKPNEHRCGRDGSVPRGRWGCGGGGGPRPLICQLLCLMPLPHCTSAQATPRGERRAAGSSGVLHLILPH